MKNKKQNQPSLSRGQILSLMELPFEYLMTRADEEKVEWGLDLDFFVDEFQKGCRCFFGVHLNQICFPVYDLQEPEQGYLNNFISWYLLTNQK